MDNVCAFSVEAVVANKLGAGIGQELSEMEIRIKRKEVSLVQSGVKAAFRYLAYRPRSEKEVREYLNKRGFDNVVEEVVQRLKKLGLIDDVVFAHFWKDNRMSFKPRSKRLLKQELLQKGISEEVVEEVTGSIDDGASAMAAGRKKARVLVDVGYPEFRRRLTNHLKLRGFGYDAINSAVNCLWQEIQSEKSL